jgi:iron complex outermembrane receptor protein
MKKLLLGICSFLLMEIVSAQIRPQGKVVDAVTGAPVASATIEIESIGTISANERGFFEFGKVRAGNYEARISSVGYRPCDTLVQFSGEGLIQIKLQRINLFLQPVEIKAIRAGEKAPFAKTNLSKKEIEKANLGQDLPYILDQTPSVVVNSDAGNGVGYTGLHIRGTDASRINMTLNGIPYNDAESQAIYFVDLPDFASSVNSIQIQRGVGTSSNGAGAFGATINFSTNEFNLKPYAEISNSIGSFNTWKNTLKVGSGLIDDHFTLDARLSRISSDGFIDRASSNLKSFYISTAWLTKNSSVRLNIISGSEKTYQAWNGIPEARLMGDRKALDQHYSNNVGSLYFTAADSLNLYNSNSRTYNYFTYKNQTDNYQQDHYQLFYNGQFSEELSFNAAGFLTRGRGYYEEYKPQQKYTDYGLSGPVVGPDTLSTTDLVRQRWLDNYFFGGIFSLQYKKEGTQISLGGGWDKYDGKHYGNITWSQNGGIPTDYQYYYEPAYKTDFNLYAKLQQQFGDHWNIFADLQYRRVNYNIQGFDDNPALLIDKGYNFINPKAGITYTNHEWQAYFSYSQASHEPNRDDFEAKVNELPKPETLHDFEWGVERTNAQSSWAATVYYMLYHDQLALTGKINDVGSYTRTNVPQSYRLGVELQGNLKINRWFSAKAALALSQNKVLNYTEYIDDYDQGGQKSFTYNKTDIAFSPALVSSTGLSFYPARNLEINPLSKFVSKQYLDNSQKEGRKLDGYYLQDLRIIYTVRAGWIKETNLILQLNNLFNKKYQSNGYTYSYYSGGSLVTENFYFPMAGINFMFAVNLKL